jgi:hypothetical protein
MRQDPMSAPVPGKKIDAPAPDFAADNYIRGRTKWGLDRMLLRITESLDLIKSAPAEDADGWIVRFHFWNKQLNPRRG